jgi:Leucine Rich repeat
VQCELARGEEKPELAKREAALWKAHAKAWKADLPKALQNAPFRRGFVCPRLREVRVNAFLKLPATDFDAAPLWAFSIPEAPASLDKLLACPHLLRVGALVFRGWIGGAQMNVRFPLKKGETRTPAQRFADAPNVRNLEELDLAWSNELRDDGLAALCESEHLTNLKRLSLVNCDVGNPGVKALAGSALGSRLELLDLQGNTRAGIDSVRALFAGGAFPRLRELHLQATIGVKGLQAIAASKPAFALRTFSVYVEEKANLEEFFAWPGLESVRDLNLMNSLIRNRAGAVFHSPRLAGLRVLRMEVNGNHPADLGAFDALASGDVLPNLEELHLPFSSFCLPDAMFEKLRARFGKNLFL